MFHHLMCHWINLKWEDSYGHKYRNTVSRTDSHSSLKDDFLQMKQVGEPNLERHHSPYSALLLGHIHLCTFLPCISVCGRSWCSSGWWVCWRSHCSLSGWEGLHCLWNSPGYLALEKTQRRQQGLAMYFITIGTSILTGTHCIMHSLHFPWSICNVLWYDVVPLKRPFCTSNHTLH